MFSCFRPARPFICLLSPPPDVPPYIFADSSPPFILLPSFILADHFRLLSRGRCRGQPLLHRVRRVGPRRRRCGHAPGGASARARVRVGRRARVDALRGDARGRELGRCGERSCARLRFCCPLLRALLSSVTFHRNQVCSTGFFLGQKIEFAVRTGSQIRNE